MSKPGSEKIWYTGGSTLAVDEDVHSNEGHGVTGLGHPGHLMIKAPL